MLKLALIFPSDPDLNTSANEDEPNFAPDSLCGRRSHPMPDVWEASFAPDFDPRSYTRTDGARETDLYSWMAMDRMEPARFAALGRLHDNIVNQRIGFDVIYSVLRHRIRDFKAACRANGFTTPAELPAELPVADGPVSPALAQLILQRDALDADISDFWNAHPIVIRQAFERGSVGEMVELFMRSAGSFWIAFARIPRVCSVPLMRLEVWSSFGCYLGPLGSENSIDILADEFSGGGMFVEFLELAVQATRVLESWIGLNPRLQYYIGSGRTVFRLLCLHVATLERLKRLGAAMDEERMVIAAAEHDVRVCLNILDRLSTKGSWMRPLAKLARKIANGEHVTDVDVDEGVGRVDLPEEEDPALAEEEAKLMKVLAVFRHKLRSCK